MFPAGLLVLLISGRLTLSNISPLALTLSNTYGVLHCASCVAHASAEGSVMSQILSCLSDLWVLNAYEFSTFNYALKDLS